MSAQVRYQDPWGGGIQACSPQRTCTGRTGPPFDSSDLQFILLLVAPLGNYFWIFLEYLLDTL